MIPHVTRFHAPTNPALAQRRAQDSHPLEPLEDPGQSDPPSAIGPEEEAAAGRFQEPGNPMYTLRSVAVGASLGVAVAGLLVMSDRDHSSPWAAVLGGALGGMLAIPPARAAIEFIVGADTAPE